MDCTVPSHIGDVMLQIHFLERETSSGNRKLLVLIVNFHLHQRSPDQNIEFFGRCGFDDGNTYDFHICLSIDETVAWLSCSRYGDELVRLTASKADAPNTLAFSGEISQEGLVIN